MRDAVDHEAAERVARSSLAHGVYSRRLLARAYLALRENERTLPEATKLGAWLAVGNRAAEVLEVAGKHRCILMSVSPSPSGSRAVTLARGTSDESADAAIAAALQKAGEQR